MARGEGDAVLLTVRDEGIGLPAGFDPGKGKSMGMRIIVALANQLGATIGRRTAIRGGSSPSASPESSPATDRPLGACCFGDTAP